MRKILILALLSFPAAVYAQELNDAELDEMPGVKAVKTEAVDSLEPVRRPDAKRIMSELSAELRLSSKQEDRISSAVGKKTAEFDKLMKEYDKTAAEDKKLRRKMGESRYAMLKINRDLPDTVREFLDDEQRQSYDDMLEAGKKPGGAAMDQGAGDEEGAQRPLKKKRVIKRKKLPAGRAAAPAAAQGEEEAGQVMVDKESPAEKPALKKKRILKKKPLVRPDPVEEEEPAGAKPTGREAAPEEEDAGSYP